MQRSSGLRRSGRLAAISDRKLAAFAAAGIYPANTLTPLPDPDAPAPTSPARRASRKPAIPAARRKTLAERSGGWCEIAMTGCTRFAVDPAHRNGTRLGGRHGEAADEHSRLSNYLHACRSCHRWSHDNPAASKAEFVGWALEEWQEPTEWPVLYRGELSWLTDDGQVVPYEEASA